MTYIRKLVFVLFVCGSSLHAQDCLPKLDLIPFNFQLEKDSSGLKTKLLHVDGTLKTSYVDSANTTYRRDYYRGGQLKRFCEVEFILRVDTEFVEDIYGEIAPIPSVGNWSDICIGIYKEWHWTGKLKTTGKFDNGKQGEWKEYFSNGKLRRICSFYNSYLVGKYEEYRQLEGVNRGSTIIKSRGNYIIAEITRYAHYKNWKEMKIGKWENYDAKGKLVGIQQHEWRGKIIKR